MVKLKSKSLALLVIGVFVLGIGGSMVFNIWKTESGKIPKFITGGEFAGQYDPGDIRGSYSFSDIESAFGIPAADLARAFGIRDAQQPGEILCKDLEELYGSVGDDREIGTDSVRLFVASYLGIPYTPEDSTVLPSFVFPVLKEQGALEEAQWESLQDLRVSVTPGVPDISHPEEDVAEDRSIKGKTTFGDLKDWGLSAGEIETILGFPPGLAGVTVRDYLSERNVEFSTVKTALQELVDSKP